MIHERSRAAHGDLTRDSHALGSASVKLLSENNEKYCDKAMPEVCNSAVTPSYHKPCDPACA